MTKTPEIIDDGPSPFLRHHYEYLTERDRLRRRMCPGPADGVIGGLTAGLLNPQFWQRRLNEAGLGLVPPMDRISNKIADTFDRDDDAFISLTVNGNTYLLRTQPTLDPVGHGRDGGYRVAHVRISGLGSELTHSLNGRFDTPEAAIGDAVSKLVRRAYGSGF